MSVFCNLSIPIENLRFTWTLKNIEKNQMNIEYITNALFVTLATIGVNLFWRKSFLLSRDLPAILLIEIFAFAFLKTASFGSGMAMFLIIIAFCVLRSIFKPVTPNDKQRNKLDIQDLINFVLTSCTIYSLVQHNNRLFSRETKEERRFHLMKLWTSIPILSLFQLIR